MELPVFLREAGYTTFTQGQGDIRIFLAGLVQAVLTTVGVIFLIMIIYGGYLWLTAGGNEEQVTKARKYIIQAVVGFVIVLVSLIITRFVTEMIIGAATPHGTTIIVP